MLELHHVHKTYTTPQGPPRVLEDVSLRLATGQSLALMGESGSGIQAINTTARDGVPLPPVANTCGV